MAQFLYLALTSLNLCMSGLALWSSARVIRLLRTHSARSALDLSAQIAAQSASLQSLSTTVRRLSSRYGMQERRGKDGRSQGPQDDLASLPTDEFKRRARAMFIVPGRPTKHGEK